MSEVLLMIAQGTCFVLMGVMSSWLGQFKENKKKVIERLAGCVTTEEAVTAFGEARLFGLVESKYCEGPPEAALAKFRKDKKLGNFTS